MVFRILSVSTVQKHLFLNSEMVLVLGFCSLPKILLVKNALGQSLQLFVHSQLNIEVVWRLFICTMPHDGLRRQR
jgi:hypothetical protein